MKLESIRMMYIVKKKKLFVEPKNQTYEKFKNYY